MALLLECLKKCTHIPHHYEKKRNYLEKKNEFYVHITMIAEIRLAALLARATLLVIVIKQGTTETIVSYLGISPSKLTSYSGTRYFKQRWMQPHPHLVIPYSKLDTTAL